MAVLSLSELNASLDAAISPRVGWLPTYFELLQVHRNIGCRSSESLNRSLWSIPGDGYAYLSPLKGNSTRQIFLSSLPDVYQDWLLGMNNRYDAMTERRLAYAFEMNYAYANVYKGMKPSSLYLFRYALVQNAYAAGATLAQLKTMFGWSSDAVVMGYVNAVLEY